MAKWYPNYEQTNRQTALQTCNRFPKTIVKVFSKDSIQGSIFALFSLLDPTCKNYQNLVMEKFTQTDLTYVTITKIED